MGTSSEQERSIEKLKKRYEALNEKKIQTRTELKRAEQDLSNLQKEAEAEFGTSDVSELKKQLEKMEQKNEKNLKEYQILLDKIESDLDAVEKAGSEPSELEAPANE